MIRTNNTRREFLRNVTIGATAMTLASGAMSATRTDNRPNIIYILADDLGYGDVGCFGQKQIKTPRLDQMAREGMRLTDHYAGCTVCAPSRATLMTGYHTGHLRVKGQGQSLLAEELTIAEMLQDAGYATGAMGKWSLGLAGTPGSAIKKGFDHWFGYLNQSHAHNYYPAYLYRNEEKVPLRNVVKFRGNGPTGASTKRVDYSHDLLVKEAMEFVDASRDKPFFLYLPFTIPHANNEGPRVLNRHGMEIPDYGQYVDRDWPEAQKGHAAMISRLDRDVGALLDRLREYGIAENTLVFFTSDNGPHKEGGADPEFFGGSGPLRGIKRDLYEGGIREPTIAWWPGKIEAGSTSDLISAFWDFMPTACDIAGLETPEGIDGISMAPTLFGAPEKQSARDVLYWEFAAKRAVRMGKWKAVRLSPEAKTELYDLSKDIGEEKDLAAKYPEIVARAEGYFESERTAEVKSKKKA